MNTSEKQQLKAQAHHLKPVILLGAKGLTPAVTLETEAALSAHELIKIKLNGIERDDKQPLIETLCQELQARLIQIVGNTATIYRKNPESKKTSQPKPKARNRKESVSKKSAQFSESKPSIYRKKTGAKIKSTDSKPKAQSSGYKTVATDQKRVRSQHKK